MATHADHLEKETFYFVTFTCYKWLPLIEITSLYDYVKGWSDQLSKRGIKLCGYVIMPNHIHLLVYVEEWTRSESSVGDSETSNKSIGTRSESSTGDSEVNKKSMNLIIGEAKRFMAYEIVKRLKNLEETGILQTLSEGVQQEERKKGKKHQVFRLSFDAKEVSGDDEIVKVLDYMHHNPVSGKWQLVEDFVDYPYSSARYYELGEQQGVMVWDFRTVGSESSAGDSEGS